jgi:hypothetical protein
MSTLEQQLNDAARAFYSALENMIGENDTTVDIESFIEQIDGTVQQIIEGE